MIKIIGKYNIANVFGNQMGLESAAEEQIKMLCDAEDFKNCKIRIMPDVHAGKGCVIGTTMTIEDKVVPSMVGVDIGCGMLVYKLKEQEIDFAALDQVIRDYIPTGKNVREKAAMSLFDLGPFRCEVNLDYAAKSVGTLGGGNHFIEVANSLDGDLYLIIHSGSRHLGVEVANHYQKLAVEKCGKIPLPYVADEVLADYLNDMNAAQIFADLNRITIGSIITEQMNLTVIDSFTTIHNYIDTKNRILRKGAVSAQLGERLIIPMNMSDGSFICEGKGNDDWNQSAPHGAGRLMSRRAARETLSMHQFEQSMKGIYSTTVCSGTLDEAPQAYKPMRSIKGHIKPTVEVKERIVPVYNYKDAPRAERY